MTANDSNGTRVSPARRRGERQLGKPLVVVLTLLTLATGYTVVRGMQLVAEEFEHGGELDDMSTRLAVLALVESVVSVGLLAAVWLRRLWGVHGYLAVKVLMVLLSSVAVERFVPLALLPVLFAGLLWVAVRQAGWRPRDPRW